MEKEDKIAYREFVGSLSVEEEQYLYSIGSLVWLVIIKIIIRSF